MTTLHLSDAAPPLLNDQPLELLHVIARMALLNPFSAACVDAVEATVGPGVAVGGVTGAGFRQSASEIRALLDPMLGAIAAELATGGTVRPADLAAYEDACFYFLYATYGERMQPQIDGRMPPEALAALYRSFLADHARLLGRLGAAMRRQCPPEHLFACCYQIRRAYHYLFRYIIGTSAVTARLRAHVWQAIFTADLDTYIRVLHDRLDDFHTLVTGPTGTGKELVAQAIARSRYIRFDPGKATFAAHDALYVPIHLGAIAPTLVEAELFGHEKGAFTGAVSDRPGCLETEHPCTIFLDEIGEAPLDVQVKLLRVTQAREIRRVGGRETRRFLGRIVAATHRDLEKMVRRGKFREDLLYRLGSPWITTPSLRAQLDEAPGDLALLVRFIADKVAGTAGGALAAWALAWIEANLPRDYAWPGNVREVEVCVRSILMGGSFRPTSTTRVRRVAATGARGAEDPFLRAVAAGTLTLDALEQGYILRALKSGVSLRETARRLGVGRNRLQSVIDEELTRPS